MARKVVECTDRIPSPNRFKSVCKCDFERKEMEILLRAVADQLFFPLIIDTHKKKLKAEEKDGLLCRS